MRKDKNNLKQLSQLKSMKKSKTKTLGKFDLKTKKDHK